MNNHMTPHPTDARDFRFLIDWLVGYRKTLRLSQREVGRRMGASATTVHYLEKHAKDVPVQTLQAYCRALGGHLEISFVLPERG